MPAYEKKIDSFIAKLKANWQPVPVSSCILAREDAQAEREASSVAMAAAVVLLLFETHTGNHMGKIWLKIQFKFSSNSVQNQFKISSNQ